jgi:prepilin-type N-terminal cleavage/methylation domain-containing protein
MITTRTDHSSGGQRGFTIIEVLIALMIVIIALVAIAGMFPQGYKQVTDAGRLTLAVTNARAVHEDIRLVPFANLVNLNGFDSTNPGTIPASPPESDLATRWHNDLTAAEGKTTILVSNCGGAGNPCGLPAPDASMAMVTVTVSMTALPQSVRLTTLVARLF